VKELYEEHLPGMAERDYEERHASSLRYGYDERPKYVLEITRQGTARLEAWADQDSELEWCPMSKATALLQAKAVLLWEPLAAAEIEAVRSLFQSA
jgi:hypothetical protein